MRGHDLRETDSYWLRWDGAKVCNECRKERVNRVREKRRAKGLPVSPRPTAKRQKEGMTPAEVEAYLQKARAEEHLPAWQKPRLMWQPRGGPADSQR